MSPQGAYAIHICYAMSTSDDERIPLSYVSIFATATFCRTLRAYIDCPLRAQFLMATPRELLPLGYRAMPATGSPTHVHVAHNAYSRQRCITRSHPLRTPVRCSWEV